MLSTSGTPSRQNTQSLQSLTLASAVGTGYFTAVVLLLHLISPEFDPMNRFISEYALGSYGYLLTTGFLALGIGSILLVVALSRLGHSGGFAWKAGLALLMVWGLSVMLDAVFPIDKGVNPVTVAGQVHLMAAMVAFLSLMVAALLLSLSFRKMPSMRGTASPALVLVGFILASFVLSAVLDTVAQGFTQRLFVLACLAWLLLVALRVRSAIS